MPIQVALHHKSHYRYDRPVQLSPQIIRLRPAPHCRTPIHEYSLQVRPENHTLHWQQDAQSNYLARLVLAEPTTELSVEVALRAELVEINPFDFFLDPTAASYPFRYDPEAARELCSYLGAEPAGPQLASFLNGIPRTGTATMEFLVDLNKRIQGEISYLKRLEPGIQNTEETLALRSGSCRDSAWLFVQIARHLGLAARFVSGYLIEVGDGDSAELHAWAEIYLPGAGWVGLDPTSGLLAAEGHIPLACTPEATRAAPITGLLTACDSKFDYQLSVVRL